MSTIIAFCGWPLSGKNTIAELVSCSLNTRWIDIDALRLFNFGPPNPNPKTEAEMEKDRNEMRLSYYAMTDVVDGNLTLGNSLIISAAFTRERYWDPIVEVVAKHSNATLKIIWCHPKNVNPEDITDRLSKREFGDNCWSTVNSIDRYEEVKGRFEPVKLPHLDLDTSQSNPKYLCLATVLGYIR